MEAHGFADLLERIDDLRAISRENAGATVHVAEEQKAVTVQAAQLATLEATHARETSAVLVQRDEVAQLHLALVSRQLAYIRARDRKSAELAPLESHRHSLEGELSKLAVSELAAEGVAGAYTGPIGNYTSTPQGEYGFFQAPGTDYSVGEEPVLVAHLNTLGIALHLHLIGISGYRTPQHSVEVGGFANDPHTRGEASDTPGIEGVPQATLARFGLIRPFPSAAEADHIQLAGQPLLTGRRQPRRRAVRHEALRQLDARVGLLTVLEQRDQRAADRHRGAVERVQRLCLLVLAHADVQAPGLVVGRVRARGQLAVACLARQPRLAVVLLRGRAPEVGDGDVHDAVGQVQLPRGSPPRSPGSARARRSTPRARRS